MRAATSAWREWAQRLADLGQTVRLDGLTRLLARSARPLRIECTLRDRVRANVSPVHVLDNDDSEAAEQAASFVLVCAPKSVSLIRAIRADDVADKAITDAHATAIAEAMEYLATHAGYTRVHNPATGEKDLVRLPGLVAIAYQHETSRAGDPHLHTHVIVPNRQARGDGQLVSIDGTSLYHEAKAAGVVYQATLRRELHRSLSYEWLPVDSSTGMSEVAGIDPQSITAWSQRSSQLREWAAGSLAVNESGELTSSQLAAAQKATRPTKPEQLSWRELRAGWRNDQRGLGIDAAEHRRARRDRLAASGPRFDRHRIADAACHDREGRVHHS